MNIKIATQQINYAAEDAHRRYITFGFAHMMLYQEKAEQAADYAAAKYPKDLAGFPLIQAEAIGSRKSAKEVANGIISKRAQWVKISAQIETIRFGAIYTLSKSTINGDIRLIAQNAIYDLSLI